MNEMANESEYLQISPCKNFGFLDQVFFTSLVHVFLQLEEDYWKRLCFC